MNAMTRPRYRVLICAAIALTTSAALTGCANPVESMIKSSSTSAADSLLSELSGVEVEGIGSTEIPADFPSSVPLPDATPQTALSNTIEGTRSWILHFEEGVNDNVFDALVAELAAGGFAEESSSNLNGAMRIAVYANSEYMVNASLLGTSEDGQILQVMVTENKPS